MKTVIEVELLFVIGRRVCHALDLEDSVCVRIIFYVYSSLTLLGRILPQRINVRTPLQESVTWIIFLLYG